MDSLLAVEIGKLSERVLEIDITYESQLVMYVYMRNRLHLCKILSTKDFNTPTKECQMATG